MKAKYFFGSSRRHEMRIRLLLIIIFLIGLTGCAITEKSIDKRVKNYAPIESSLSQINQKVSSHFLKSGVPEGFNKEQYKTAVEEVCYSNNICKSKAQNIFDSFGVDARKIDGVFSVMLCDKAMNWKAMEDLAVIIRT
jgi:hypothetical protein